MAKTTRAASTRTRKHKAAPQQQQRGTVTTVRSDDGESARSGRAAASQTAWLAPLYVVAMAVCFTLGCWALPPVIERIYGTGHDLRRFYGECPVHGYLGFYCDDLDTVNGTMSCHHWTPQQAAQLRQLIGQPTSETQARGDVACAELPGRLVSLPDQVARYASALASIKAHENEPGAPPLVHAMVTDWASDHVRWTFSADNGALRAVFPHFFGVG